MRHVIKLWSALVLAVALAAAAPAALASAAPAHHSRVTSAVSRDGRLAVSVPVTPGRHAMSEKFALPAGSARLSGLTAPQLVAADTTNGVQVRVGKNNCAGFNGNIAWSFAGAGIDQWFFILQGTAWDDCGYYTHPTQEFIYINFTCGGGVICAKGQNIGIDGPKAPGTAYVSEGINLEPIWTGDALAPSDVKVDACLKWNDGWGCGPAQSV
jgi:hypothetical protein